MHAIEKEDDIAFPMIIHALGLLGDVRAFNAIAVHLQSANSYHRGLAADALGHLGDRRAVELLTPLLSDTAIAWQEDHGPEISVAQIARGALQQLL